MPAVKRAAARCALRPHLPRCAAIDCLVGPDLCSNMRSHRAQAKQKHSSADPKIRGTVGGLRILFRSALFKRLTICLMVSGWLSETSSKPLSPLCLSLSSFDG